MLTASIRISTFSRGEVEVMPSGKRYEM